MRLYNMIGYKLFKELDDGSVHLVRIIGMHKPYKITSSTKDPSEITIYDYSDNERKKVRVDSLKDYHQLKPDGIATFSVVTIRENDNSICKDVIVSATKFLNLELKLATMPYAVCRQNITDIFYNLMSTDDSKTLVGLSVNQDTCPSNFDFRMMFAADSVEYSDFINFYRSDTVDDLLNIINLKKYNTVLEDLYSRHIKHINHPELLFKKEHDGWCKDLKTLLEENNFQTDINQMLNITQVDFDMSEYITTTTKNGHEFEIITDDLKVWVSSVFKTNMDEVLVVKYDHDVNIGDFNENNYVMIRDNTNTLYILVYTVAGEYFEEDLKDESNKMDFSTKFRLSFIDTKYAEFTK